MDTDVNLTFSADFKREKTTLYVDLKILLKKHKRK